MIPETTHLSSIAFILSIITALFFYNLPLADTLMYWRPPFVLLIALHWLLITPTKIGLGSIWLAGLCLDLLYANILGQYTLAMFLTAYLVKKQEYRLRNLPSFLQSMAIIIIVSIYQTLWLGSHLVSTDISLEIKALYPALSSALIWPLLTKTLSRLNRLLV